METVEIVLAFTETDPLDRHMQLFMDREDHAAFRRAIELGQDDPCQRHDLSEIFRLADGILPRGRIQDEERLMRCIRDDLLDDAGDLGKLFHQIHLRLQTAGGIDKDDIDAARLGC